MKNLASPFVSGVLRRIATEIGVDPYFAYRAFVDRAHAACVSRLAEASSFTAAILVTTQTIGGIGHVSICDNGDALGPGEVRVLYDAIRTGRAGTVQRALIATGVDGAHTVVGRLGSALLAAFSIADQVTIATRSHVVRPEAGIRFTCTSQTYGAVPYRMARPGTNIQLRIRPEFQALASVVAVRDALIEHARGLSLPVQINV